MDGQNVPLTLTALQQDAYRIAVARGQWPERAERAEVLFRAQEVLEEETREADRALFWLWYDVESDRIPGPGKREAVTDELADVVIVCASIAQALGIDLEEGVRRKMAVNEERARIAKREGAGEDGSHDGE